MNKLKLPFTAGALFVSTHIFAQTGQAFYDYLTDPIILIFSVGVIFVLIALAAINKALNTLRYLTIKQTQGEEAAEALRSRSVLSSMTEAKSAEEEAEMMTDHEYDGIHELDNDLPPWWKWGFYITIVWAVVYSILYFGTGDIPTGTEEFETKMAEAQEQVDAYLASVGGAIDETNVVFTTEKSALLKGADIFASNCAACHMADGGGQVGPNLTDEYWLHGGDIVSVFKTVKYGVPAKGMIAWEDQLGPEAMQNVASYILTLQGTSPANPKAPEGEKVSNTPKETDESNAETTTTETEATVVQDV